MPFAEGKMVDRFDPVALRIERRHAMSLGCAASNQYPVVL